VAYSQDFSTGVAYKIGGTEVRGTHYRTNIKLLEEGILNPSKMTLVVIACHESENETKFSSHAQSFKN
jgi:hypothetical protein